MERTGMPQIGESSRDGKPIPAYPKVLATDTDRRSRQAHLSPAGSASTRPNASVSVPVAAFMPFDVSNEPLAKNASSFDEMRVFASSMAVDTSSVEPASVPSSILSMISSIAFWSSSVMESFPSFSSVPCLLSVSDLSSVLDLPSVSGLTNEMSVPRFDLIASTSCSGVNLSACRYSIRFMSSWLSLRSSRSHAEVRVVKSFSTRPYSSLMAVTYSSAASPSCETSSVSATVVETPSFHSFHPV